jgi:PII-like signaling protein
MRTRTPAKILRLHFSGRDRYRGKPLHEAIVQTCREMNVCGATVLRGLEGYGETGEMHRHHLGANDEPVIVVIVDTEEKLRTCIPVFEQMMETGIMALSDVEMIRIVHDPAPPN